VTWGDDDTFSRRNMQRFKLYFGHPDPDSEMAATTEVEAFSVEEAWETGTNISPPNPLLECQDVMVLVTSDADLAGRTREEWKSTRGRPGVITVSR
jgi:hypothetical protein